MKVMFVSWIATAIVVFMVAGRNIDQALLATKIAVLGAVLGFIGGKLYNAYEAYNQAKSIARR